MEEGADSVLRLSEIKERRCKTCARWREKPGEYGLLRTYCTLDGKERFSIEGKGCLGWKERKNDMQNRRQVYPSL